MTTNFVGSGFSIPFGVDHRGAIAMSSGAEGIEDGLVTVLSTAPGERVMRPAFGCEIWNMVFDPINASSLGRMEEAVRDAVGMWEPRVELEDVDVVPDPRLAGGVQINITYRIQATNDRRNLVYPFYMIPEEVES